MIAAFALDYFVPRIKSGVLAMTVPRRALLTAGTYSYISMCSRPPEGVAVRLRRCGRGARGARFNRTSHPGRLSQTAALASTSANGPPVRHYDRLGCLAPGDGSARPRVMRGRAATDPWKRGTRNVRNRRYTRRRATGFFKIRNAAARRQCPFISPNRTRWRAATITRALLLPLREKVPFASAKGG
jgi:hypothetical protein